ncbi:MAG: pyridoxal phosphate-dependent aminotransferase [Armatimonadetes bacterium]|nr:pyridoxal phosphate-dependent aminotransferase [Armatimonadota bacterium]
MKTACLSARATQFRPSPTLAITAKAKELKAAGKDVVSLAAGEPDFDTPGSIVEAAKAAIDGGQTKYTPTPGTPQLRQAIVDKLARDNGIEAGIDQIVVSCGAKQSLFNSVMTLVDPGDEVVLFAPYWMTYVDQAEFAGGTVKVVQTDPRRAFVPEIADIEAALSPRTKVVVLNSPSNPSGAVFDRETLEWLARKAVQMGFWIVSDEIYEKLVYGQRHVSVASLGGGILDQTVTVNGCSKSYAMTGWRIGYACAPKPVAKAMSSLQDQVTSNATSFAQAGAVAALSMDPAETERMRMEFENRRDLVCSLLAEIPGVHLEVPRGAFYVLPDFSAYLSGRISTDTELANFLLETALVATVPGSVFGAPGHLRMSYAASGDDIRKGVARIAEALSKPSP